MLFSSLVFLNLFLPAVLAGSFFLPARGVWRNAFLLAASLVFYAWGESVRIAYLLAVILLAHFSAAALPRVRSQRARNALAAAACLLLVLGLVHYKYSAFLARNLEALLGVRISVHPAAMPLGISFFTFQALSYVVDVWRGTSRPQPSLWKTALFVSLFPQLVAGPIVKYRDLESQLGDHRVSPADVADGLRRFVVGLAKKVLLANPIGAVADTVFALPPDALDPAHAWVGALAYALQIFFDFGGYSDMAIGLCAAFGFKIPENFDYPYLSRSVTEFWRRWHISLSSWFREYLYIPLGGNRVARPRLALNLLLVFLVTGLWHGAEWTFVLWGLWHGVCVVAERFTPLGKPRTTRLGNLAQRAYALLAVLFGWVIFRAETVTAAAAYFRAMFGLADAAPMDAVSALLPNSVLVAVFAAILASCGAFRSLLARKSPAGRLFADIWLLLLFLASEWSLAASSYNPFIYFRF